jgi:hypothetical protein
VLIFSWLASSAVPIFSSMKLSAVLAGAAAATFALAFLFLLFLVFCGAANGNTS